MQRKVRRRMMLERVNALNFLRNISLDGNENCENKVEVVLRLRKIRGSGDDFKEPPSANVIEVKAEVNAFPEGEPILAAGSVLKSVVRDDLGSSFGSQFAPSHEIQSTPSSIHCKTMYDSDLSRFSDGSKSSETSKLGSAVPFRERTNTTGSDYSGDRRATGGSRRKRVLCTPMLADDKFHRNYSSNESLASSTIAKSKMSSNQELTAPISKEVKVVKFNQLPKQATRGQRLILTTKNKVPFLICSHIPYTRNYRTNRPEQRKEAGRRRNTSGPRPLSSINDSLDPFDLLGIERSQEGMEISYGSSWFLQNNSSVRRKCYLWKWILVKLWLQGNTKQCQDAFRTIALLETTVLLFQPHLLSFSLNKDTSVIDYVRPFDLKKELNDKFKEKFPNVELTLSKLRSLKSEMRKIAKHDKDPDLLTVAQAYVYFEKLVLRMLINKENRKLCAGACLILSAKLNDIKGEALKQLMERTENVFRLNRKDLLASEFAILIALEFGLHVPVWQIMPHYQRLVSES
ncbi:LOW QUALITY PROTEIN: uncharacterized protein LOC111044586 [Nilaparvata lugens]|uniref:LOW QUALITY PROTEIN: uncharacterized protein LOC111044586 n=1 Tax=Nilaparvata lugens TaxID=108931 RepID=UPI00193D4332|nr:LOW QUALITY PROTEIN: uncharacterized protein LOC111044586 [Nilaparvata lugens]